MKLTRVSITHKRHSLHFTGVSASHKIKLQLFVNLPKRLNAIMGLGDKVVVIKL